MEKIKLADTVWHPSQKLVVTQLSGDIEHTDVIQWINSLETVLQLIPDHQSFKILVNLHGFKAVDIDTHKYFRTVIPETLARHGWKTGYVHLFEEAANMAITTSRGVRCVAAAHVHHDETKIEKYETMFGTRDERFFTDIKRAEAWIEIKKV